MWGPPTCSQDVREAREAELEDAATAAAAERRRRIDQLLHDRFCRDGWFEDDENDEAGRPVPCAICHPGIEQRLARSRGAVA